MKKSGGCFLIISLKRFSKYFPWFTAVYSSIIKVRYLLKTKTAAILKYWLCCNIENRVQIFINYLKQTQTQTNTKRNQNQ